MPLQPDVTLPSATQLAHFQQVLDCLADGTFHSSADMTERLQVSRTMIWKMIRALQNLGVPIQSLHGKGYQIPGGMELLSLEKIKNTVPRAYYQLLQRAHLFLLCDSTNHFLLNQIREGVIAPQLCLAECQFKGRGRHGQPWISPFGQNIYLSLHWCFASDLASLSGLPLAIGVIVVRALRKFGAPDIQLKWPNDITYADRKLGGILVEVQGDAAGPCHAVMGIGLNVNMQEDEASQLIDQPWTKLQTIMGSAIPLSRNHLVACLIEELLHGILEFEKNGLAAFLSQWRQADSLAGHDVLVTTPAGVLSGTALGVDEMGALMLRTDDKIHYFRGQAVSIRKQVKISEL